MQYRKMPGSNEPLSALGYGCMRMPTKGRVGSTIDVEKAKEQILYAIDNGVNYLDTAYPYHRGASESFLGEHILKDGYREKVNIATKLPVFMINKPEKFDEIFSKQLKNPSKSPSMYRLMMFRMARNIVKIIDPSFQDYQYYQEKGWFESSYYYDTTLGIHKRIAGKLFDFMGRYFAKSQ